MLRRQTFSIFFCLTLLCSRADVIHIDTERLVEDDQFKKSQAILPIYQFTSTLIEEYKGFGAVNDDELGFFEIRQMPDMSACHDTGYTYIYFSGADNEFRQGYLLTLIGNFKRSRRTIYFYIDRNNDLDFSNDGEPDSLTMTEGSKLITLENVHVPEAKYSILLSRFVYGQNADYKSLLTQHYKNHSGSKIFTDINFCYREQRYNTVVAHYKSESDSFTIGLKDMNVNGLYSEACTDMIYVGSYGSTVASDELFDLTPTINKNSFEWNGKKYRFVRIENNGQYVEIKLDPNATLSNKLELGKKVPDITYYNILNKSHQLSEFKKFEQYIFFWDLESMTAEDTVYLAKLHREFQDRLKVTCLNHGDEPKMVRIYYFYEKISFPVGYSNSNIGRDFFLEDVPRGYYLGKRRKLKNDKISPREMYELMHSSADK